MYSTVKQLVDAWPPVVVARSAHRHPQPAFSAVCSRRFISINNNNNNNNNRIHLAPFAKLRRESLRRDKAAIKKKGL